MTVMTCGPCRHGDHAACVGWALDDHDREIDCPCTCSEDA